MKTPKNEKGKKLSEENAPVPTTKNSEKVTVKQTKKLS